MVFQRPSQKKKEKKINKKRKNIAKDWLKTGLIVHVSIRQLKKLVIKHYNWDKTETLNFSVLGTENNLLTRDLVITKIT